MKFFIFSILSIVLLSFCLSESEAKQKKKLKQLKYCHANQFLVCFGELRAFTAIVNGTGIVTNEHQMDQFCGSVNY